MNRYPLWKYLIIGIVVLLGVLYTLPNFFGEAPAIQISSVRATEPVTPVLIEQVQKILNEHQLSSEQIFYEQTSGASPSVRIRFSSTDLQFKAKSLLEQSLNTDLANPAYIIAFNLLPNTPAWLRSIHALPMYLGLDLRGGVHFLMQVDTQSLFKKQLQNTQSNVKSLLRENKIHYAQIQLQANLINIQFRDVKQKEAAIKLLREQLNTVEIRELKNPSDAQQVDLELRLSEQAIKNAQNEGVQQNLVTLSRRINELGVAEPIIQRQGANRIIVQLPGVQDVSRAKDIIGRTATLEVRMVDENVMRGSEESAAISVNSELFRHGRSAPVVLYRDAVLTGDYITAAHASFDQNQQAAVSVDLNGEGGRRMQAATRDRIGKLMAIVLFEKNSSEVLTVATIQDQLGARFQITGMGSTQAANDLALLLRAGSLAAPMDIVEERTIGPQLGAENIKKGFYATLYGFVAIAIFMILYYRMFGVFSVLALSINLLLLIGLLSILQATLTLPGIAAIALTLGMAIDANVLINERVREELRNGKSPAMAIQEGFAHAWATILDSNVTTFIAGLALFVCGSGAIRGFAVVHCLGILTSIFASVFVSRGLVNAWYGYRRKKLQTLAIGQVWKPVK